jgi:class I fructose-bisphosphate aldolase
MNCYAGRISMLNSGGVSKGTSDFKQAIRAAIINKRAGGSGIIMGRKAFQRPLTMEHKCSPRYLLKGRLSPST